MRLNLFHCLLAVSAIVSFPYGAQAAYVWAGWTNRTDGTSSTATLAGLGSATLTPQGPRTATGDFGVFRFDNVGFTPTTLNTVGWVGATNPGAIWGYTLDLGGFASTNGLIVGVGNFGHIPGDPQWRLSAFNSSNAPIALSTFTQIGSFDHTWVTAGNQQFNDNLTLDTTTGLFSIATTPGVNDINSDIMLFRLPAGVSKIQVASVAPYFNADLHNLILGVEDTVVASTVVTPAPAGLTLLASGGAFMAMGAYLRRRYKPLSMS